MRPRSESNRARAEPEETPTLLPIVRSAARCDGRNHSWPRKGARPLPVIVGLHSGGLITVAVPASRVLAVTTAVDLPARPECGCALMSLGWWRRQGLAVIQRLARFLSTG